MLAIERGELDGIVGYSWSVARSGNKEQLDNGSLKIILQVALNKHPDLPNVPLVDRFRQKLHRPAGARPDFLAQSHGPAAVGAARSRSRRGGSFAHRRSPRAMHDPALIAGAKKIDLDLNFVSGDDVQA